MRFRPLSIVKALKCKTCMISLTQSLIFLLSAVAALVLSFPISPNAHEMPAISPLEPVPTVLEQQALREQVMIDSSHFADQRAMFLRTERQVWKMDFDELARAINALGDYPLSPYLLARKLEQRISLRYTEQIRVFLEQYESAPFARRLRHKWLKYLARRKEYSLFVEFYRPTNRSDIKCEFINAQLELGVLLAEVHTDIAALWNVGKSQVDNCDSVFKPWMKSEFFTEDLVLMRIKKSADGGKHQLIPYLRGLLPEHMRYLADLWRGARRNPQSVSDLNRFPSRFPLIESEIMTYALQRFAWRDIEQAIKTFKKADKKISFNSEQRSLIYARFAIKLAIDNHVKAEEWLIRSAEQSDNVEVTRWHLAYLLKQKAWNKITLLVEKSKPQTVSDNEFSYWLARAYEKLQQNDKANTLYRQLAEGRNYYGFMASARLNQAYELSHQTLQVQTDSLQRILSMGGVKRALELREMGRMHEARLEWRYAQRRMSDQDELASAAILSEWGWHDQAIFTFSREGYTNDVARRFPTAYDSKMIAEAKKNGIQPEWAFAIARRESSFMEDAVSPANARGLMQLLPSTARYIDRQRVSSRQLLDADVNIRLGNKYLRYLMNKLNDNSLLATASYNAGWRNVKAWLPEKQPLEADIWIELIPYKETRNYVKAVYAYKQIYSAQLNQHSLISLQVPEVFSELIDTNIPSTL